MLRLKLPKTLAVTLLCSCHSGGHPATDAPLDSRVTPISDARPVDAFTSDAPPADAGVDAILAVDAQPADAMVAVDAPAMPDAAVAVDAAAMPDAVVAIDAMPDADLG